MTHVIIPSLYISSHAYPPHYSKGRVDGIVCTIFFRTYVLTTQTYVRCGGGRSRDTHTAVPRCDCVKYRPGTRGGVLSDTVGDSHRGHADHMAEGCLLVALVTPQLRIEVFGLLGDEEKCRNGSQTRILKKKCSSHTS